MSGHDVGASPSRHWRFEINFGGYRAPSVVTALLPERALGVQPPNQASNMITVDYIPPSAASHQSVLQCNTGLQPVFSVRRGCIIRCVLTLRDAFGDTIKGVTSQFEVTTRGGGAVTPLQAELDATKAVFRYSPPQSGDTGGVEVAFTSTGEPVAGGLVTFDVVDEPTHNSKLECQTSTALGTAVGAGSVVRCIIYPKRAGSVDSKAVPADFHVHVNATGHDVIHRSAIAVIRGGYMLAFNFTVPKSWSTVHGFLKPVNMLGVYVTVANASIKHGVQAFDVTHRPSPALSELKCEVYLPCGPSNTSKAGVARIRFYEVMHCVVTSAAVLDGQVLPIKATAALFNASANAGFTSDLVPGQGRLALEFWCVARTVVAACTGIVSLRVVFGVAGTRLQQLAPRLWGRFPLVLGEWRWLVPQCCWNSCHTRV
mgnify:CR=1 FL=1